MFKVCCEGQGGGGGCGGWGGGGYGGGAGGVVLVLLLMLLLELTVKHGQCRFVGVASIVSSPDLAPNIFKLKLQSL